MGKVEVMHSVNAISFFYIFVTTFIFKHLAMEKEKYLILQELKSLLQSHLKNNLKEIVLFGSQVDAQKPLKDSDYDILILLNQSVDWKTQRLISDLCYEIELKHNITIDTHILSQEDLDTLRGKQPIFQNALSTGLHV